MAVVESDTNCLRSTEGEIINSPWGFRKRFMDESVLPCTFNTHPELLRVKTGQVKEDHIQHACGWPYPSVVPTNTRLPVHTYPLQLNQPFSLLLSSTLKELKLLSRTITFKAALIVSNQLLKPQGANSSEICIYTYINVYIYMHLCMHRYMYIK